MVFKQFFLGKKTKKPNGMRDPPPFIANAIVNFHIFLPSPKMNMNMNVISNTINVLSQEEGRGALEEQRLPTLQNARSLQDEVGSSH